VLSVDEVNLNDEIPSLKVTFDADCACGVYFVRKAAYGEAVQGRFAGSCAHLDMTDLEGG